MAPARGIALWRMPEGMKGDRVVGSQRSTPLRVGLGSSYASKGSVKSEERTLPARRDTGHGWGAVLMAGGEVVRGGCQDAGGKAVLLCCPSAQ